MREDDDQIRHFMPVLRRIIILVAVLTAIPVAMWTITVFVRTYVGQPKTPMFQPVTASRANTDQSPATTPSSKASIASADTKSAPLPTMVEAKATTTDAGVEAPAGTPTTANTSAAAPGNGPAPATNAMPANATPTGAAPASLARADAGPAAGPSATAASTNFAAPADPARPNSDNTTQFAAQQPVATNWPAPPAAEPLPAGEPIAGPVPLPRMRPRTVTVAQSGVPLPRPRPDAAGPSAPEAPATPLSWIHSIFQPQSGGADTSQPANSTDTPH
jgi:hypothetical protein